MATDFTRPSSDTVDALRASVDGSRDILLEELGSLVAIPGIAWDSFDAADLERSAEAVAGLLRDLPFDSVEILREPRGDAPGHPAVVARKAAAPGYPTILLYAHYDVQPPGKRELWNTEPFEAVEKDGRLWGRGAADDKAGVMVHVGALRAFFERIGEHPGLGVTVFIEGEEEAGSPGFEDFLAAHRDKLAADVIVIADSANWEVGVPALTTSLRGVVGGIVEVSVLDHSVHSGMFGGPVLDAPTLLSRLIATLHDDDGAVAVAGLLSEDDTDVDYDEDRFREDAGVLDSVQLAGRGSISSRLWTQPALSVTGIDVTDVATASNTIAATARAKLSLRIAPGQDEREAGEALRKHVEDNAPFGAHVSFALEETGPAFRADTGAVSSQIALWAFEQAWGRPAVTAGMGGSIPFTATLTRAYPEAQILITGIEDPDTRAHSANESLHIGDFLHAVTAEALVLAALAQQGERSAE
ncbi:dipeptidase [Kocuria sp. ICS0012]|uniref:dipeptidase n=1 Tax=Kocuria sp. ICS0012 TaxID=1834155 RepID=UPI0007EAB1DE|nr:dipeptidase [Kocuria sp. ICS0012]OBA51105.1 dipeptidase [Kocuria sp. ICS0012]